MYNEGYKTMSNNYMYLGTMNSARDVTVKRPDLVYGLYDEVVAKLPLIKAQRFIRLYNYLYCIDDDALSEVTT